MKKVILSIGGAGLAILVLVGSVAAASPTPAGGQARDQLRERDTIATVLGLSQSEIAALRADGLSLAQIAERQKVDPQKLVDALAAQWTERIEVRLSRGAISNETATQLKSQVELRARDQVYKTTTGGMRGLAVGAGPQGAGRGVGAGAGGGAGAGTGMCDGTGPHGSAWR